MTPDPCAGLRQQIAETLWRQRDGGGSAASQLGLRAFADLTPETQRGYLRRASEIVDAHVLPLVEALDACEQNLRLIHEAAGHLPDNAPMPSHDTFSAWRLAHAALDRVRTPTDRSESDGE